MELNQFQQVKQIQMLEWKKVNYMLLKHLELQEKAMLWMTDNVLII